MLLLGGNGTLSIKSFRKWPLLWDCFVPPWRGLPELAVSWGCPAFNAETVRKGRDRKFCLFLLLSPRDLQNLSLTLIVLLWSQPTGQPLQWQLFCKKALLFVRSFRSDHCWHHFKYIIGCIRSYQAFLCWAFFEAWSSSVIWSAALQELCFAPSNWYKSRYKFPNCCPMWRNLKTLWKAPAVAQKCLTATTALSLSPQIRRYPVANIPALPLSML